MTTSVAIMRVVIGPRKFLPGDVVSPFEGSFNRFKATQVRQSPEWRVAVVEDAPMDFWLPYLKRAEVGDKVLLRRVRYVDIDALEADYMRRHQRSDMLPDEILYVDRAKIVEFTRDRNVPNYPGVIS
jgi:hypothetical protein